MKEIPINREVEKPYTFPIANRTIRNVLSTIPDKDLEGIEAIIVKSPEYFDEHGPLGRYDLMKKTIILFAQYTAEDGELLTCRGDISKKQFKEVVVNEVIYHEVGHHVSNDSGEDSAIEYSLKMNPNLRKLAKKWSKWSP